MTTEAPEFSADEREILPLLPMLYVAWADGELTVDELTELRAQLPSDVAALDHWLAGYARANKVSPKSSRYRAIRTCSALYSGWRLWIPASAVRRTWSLAAKAARSRPSPPIRRQTAC